MEKAELERKKQEEIAKHQQVGQNYSVTYEGGTAERFVYLMRLGSHSNIHAYFLGQPLFKSFCTGHALIMMRKIDANTTKTLVPKRHR